MAASTPQPTTPPHIPLTTTSTSIPSSTASASTSLAPVGATSAQSSSSSSTSSPSLQDHDMAVSAVPSAPVDVGGPTAASLKSISPIASAALAPNAADASSLNLPLLGTMSPDEAQRFGLGHLHNIGPGASYSSPPQPFRPPTTSPQPFQSKPTPTAPSPVVKPTDVTPAPAASAAASATSASPTPAPPSHKQPPVVPGMGTLPPNVSAAASSSEPPRAIPTNKNNPAFLNKLRSMVDDPNTDELIRWSPDGASFFVPNHVRFGDEVLPRFFKHNRFSSFVRQLNMYGFHKVPHLQQGALKHDSPQESELWEFSNPHFHRDHPDWLAKVQRKKGPRDDKDNQAEREPSAATTGQELMHAGALMRTDFGAKDAAGEGGALQLASVLNAINAIKNAQTSISSDLRHLQNSNQNLWQEAVESRQRAKRQQETINKILRFLAGVFGNQDDPETPVPGKKGVSAKGRGGNGGRRVGVRPQARNKGRLMIEDGKSSPVRGLEGLELPADEDEIEEMPSHLRFQEASSTESPKGNSPSTSQGGSRFTQIGSPPSNSMAADLSGHLNEAVSTPGGSRRLSSQASNQVLNALASGEGNAWLASLFGASLANQGSKSTGPASGGGLKLDPHMVAALQQALASAGSGAQPGASNEGGNDYFGGGTSDAADLESRFSTFPSSTTSKGSTSQLGDGLGASTASGQGLGLDADALARIAGISQALIQSPARQNFGTAAGGYVSSPSKSSGAPLDSDESNQQLALSLSRATRDLNSTEQDVDHVQNSINSLIEGLQTNPNLLQGLAGQPPANAEVPASAAWQQPVDPTNAFGAGMLNGAFDPVYASGTTPPPSAAAGGPPAGGMESDFDVDSFLSQFVDSSQAPGGGVASPSNQTFGESPSFAFSPATTAAFLHGAAGPPVGEGIYAAETGSASSGGTTPEKGVKGKKRKPSTTTPAAAVQDVDMAPRPQKKSAARK